jgi:hypothetical protein
VPPDEVGAPSPPHLNPLSSPSLCSRLSNKISSQPTRTSHCPNLDATGTKLVASLVGSPQGTQVPPRCVVCIRKFSQDSTEFVAYSCSPSQPNRFETKSCFTRCKCKYTHHARNTGRPQKIRHIPPFQSTKGPGFDLSRRPSYLP